MQRDIEQQLLQWKDSDGRMNLQQDGRIIKVPLYLLHRFLGIVLGDSS